MSFYEGCLEEPSFLFMASSLIDHAIDAAGFGRLQLTTLVAAGLTWSGDAMEMSVMAYVLPSLKAEWQVSQAAADSLASVIFAGMLIGALGWGIFSDAYGRRFGWLLTAALTAVAGLLSALAPSWQLFLLFRILVGIGLAGTNLGFALSSELLPRHARGTQLMLFELFFVGGSVSVVMLAWMLLLSLDGERCWCCRRCRCGSRSRSAAAYLSRRAGSQGMVTSALRR